MALLQADAWIQIGLHLKPRYLAKLMQTCKGIRAAVDNKTYWTRVAAHMVWRRCENLEIFDHEGELFKGLPLVEENLFHLLGLEHGYYWGMERFLWRLDEAIAFDSIHGRELPAEWWQTIAPMTLEDRTREWLKVGEDFNGKKWPAQYAHLSMQQLAKRLTIQSLSIRDDRCDYDGHFNRFLCEIEDEDIPVKYKRSMMKKFKNLIWNSWFAEPEADCSDISAGICKF